MKLKAADVNAAKKLLSNAKTVAIISPDRPDYDSVTANLALAAALEKQKKPVHLVAFEQLSDKYQWLGGADTYIDKKRLSAIKPKPDVSVMMDMSGPENASKLLVDDEWLIKDAQTLLIDHHSTQSTHDISLSLVDPEAASTTELLYWLLKDWGWEINRQMAELLLLGIIFDTNRFYNANTDAAALSASSELVAIGVDFYELNRRYEQSQALSDAEYRKLAELEQKAVVENGVAYGKIPYAQVKEFGKRTSFVGRLVEDLRSIKDVQIAFVVAEAGDGEVFVSMRSQPGLNIANVAEKYRGGGHEVAAVARFPDDTMETAEKTILKEVKKLL